MKQKLRNKYLNIRKNINNRNIKDNLIYDKVINDKDINNYDLVLIYVSYNYEVDTIKLISYFLKKKRVAVPRIDNGIMNFYYINSLDELKKGYFDILEPVSNNIVNDYSNAVSITPGICFDKRGYRIGYGKGFYDKFYSKYNVYKVGVCYKECLIDRLNNSEYDIPVDKVITD